MNLSVKGSIDTVGVKKYRLFFIKGSQLVCGKVLVYSI